MTAPLVPAWLPDAVVRRPLIEVAPERALVRFPGVGRIVAGADGSRVRAPSPGVDAAGLDFLDDVVDALAAVLRAEFALRASAVEVDGAAVVLCANSAAGKSTIAAALASRGHRFLGDALVVVSADDGTVTVRCPPRGPVLWPNGIRRLGLDPEAGLPVRRGLEARRFPIDAGAESVPLGAVVRITPAWVDPVSAVRGFDAMTDVIHACWHRFAIGPLGRLPQQFAWAVAVARAVPVLALEVPRGRRDPFVNADAVLDLLGSVRQW